MAFLDRLVGQPALSRSVGARGRLQDDRFAGARSHKRQSILK